MYFISSTFYCLLYALHFILHVYDLEQPGCDPEYDRVNWPRKIVPGSEGGVDEFSLRLESEDASGSVLVYGVYGFPDARVDKVVTDTTVQNYTDHLTAEARTTEPGYGAMLNAGQRVGMQGYVGSADGGGSVQTRSVAAAQRLGSIFALVFGRDYSDHCGWYSMLAHQHYLYGGQCPAWPLCWQLSYWLGNAMHNDRDGDRSFAVWVGRGYTWLLFPRHGLAIKLMHGTWISWDGARLPHCTAYSASAELYSSFCSIPRDTCLSLARTRMCMHIMKDRAVSKCTEALCAMPHVSQLVRPGMPVFLRWTRSVPDDMLAHAQRTGNWRKVTQWRHAARNIKWTQCLVEEVDTHPCARRCRMSGGLLDGGVMTHECRPYCVHVVEVHSRSFHCLTPAMAHNHLVLCVWDERHCLWS